MISAADLDRAARARLAAKYLTLELTAAQEAVQLADLRAEILASVAGLEAAGLVVGRMAPATRRDGCRAHLVAGERVAWQWPDLPPPGAPMYVVDEPNADERYGLTDAGRAALDGSR